MFTLKSPQKLRITAGTTLALAASLFLTACADPQGQGDVDALEPVEVTSHEDSVPDVEIDGEIDSEEITTRLLEEGDGDTLEVGDLAIVKSALIDPSTAETQGESFSSGGEALTLDENLEAQDEVLYNSLLEFPVGSIFAYYIPADQFGAGTQARLLIVEIDEKRPTSAWGEEVDPELLPDHLPEVTVDEETDEPLIATPEGDPPADLQVVELREGDGEEITENSYVQVQYRGITWDDGEEFDATWSNDGTSTGFQITGLIQGWQEGLLGQREGSRVMIVVPPELGYGEQGAGDNIGPNETLVFVVDVLHVVDMAPVEQPEPAPAQTAPDTEDEETAGN